jgi:hypothetical protein
VYTEVRYPTFLTPQLSDLLKKMLTKDPERRINLEMIKNHPWFSQSEYAILRVASSSVPKFTGTTSEAVIDHDIIDQINGLGIDCHDLHSALLTGQFTELAALYHIILREKAKDKMKDLMQTMQKSGAAKIQRPPVLAPAGGKPFPASPIGAKPGAGPRVLATPVAGTAAARRGSRPVAVRKTPIGGAEAGSGSHETP